MKYTADCGFHIGRQHLNGGLPCQDYALCGPIPQGAYSVVSDGCSSGGKTDVGARITALTVAKLMEESHLFPYINHILDGISYSGYQLGLFDNDMLATCSYVRVDRGHINVNIIGDGVIAWQVSCGDILMERLDWKDNTPFYPIYMRTPAYDTFLAKQDALTVTYEYPGGSGKCFPRVLEATFGYKASWTPNACIKKIALFSDGVCQVEGMDWRDVVRELMDFKSLEGDFVKRRLNKFVKKHTIIDDLAMTCIQIEKDENDA